MTSLSDRPVLGRGLRAAARVLLGALILLVGLVLISSALSAAGFQRDSLDCGSRLPPPSSGVSLEAMVRVHHDPQVLPLGLRCLYQGAQGQTVVVSDIKMWHTLALLAGLIMMVWGGSLPFIRRRHFRVLTPGPKAARPL